MIEFKKYVVETPITRDCFEMDDFVESVMIEEPERPKLELIKEDYKPFGLIKEIYTEIKKNKYLKELM